MLLVYPMRAPAGTTSLPVLFPCKLGGAENDCKNPGKEIAADRIMLPCGYWMRSRRNKISEESLTKNLFL